MPSTNEYRKAIDESLRVLLSEKWGQEWANSFCDGLLLRLISPKDDCKIHLWSKGNGAFQVNVDIGNNNAYTSDETSDPLGIVGERLAEMVRSTNAV